MINKLKQVMICVVVLMICSAYTQLYAKPKSQAVQRPQEMELDARVIKGQKAEGAVYLFQRVQRPLPPLLSFKRNELKAIVLPVFNQTTKIGQQFLTRSSQSRLISADAKTSNKKTNSISASPTTKSKKKSTKRKKWSRKKKYRKRKKR